jgi:hypothetical protein
MEDWIPGRLRFPAPPPGGATASDEQVGTFVDAVLAWRDAVEHAIRHERASLPDRLTDRAAALMLELLHREDRDPITDSPYLIRPFPASVARTRWSYYDLMRWRVGFADMVSDIWDVVGEPAYDMKECAVLETFLHPVDIEQRCHSCLEVFPAARRHCSAHDCSMFAYITAHWDGLAARARSRAEQDDPVKTLVGALVLTLLMLYWIARAVLDL